MSANPSYVQARPAERTALGEGRAIAALGLGYLVCIALLPVGIDQAFGLPAHPLLLHVPVVLIPVLVLATVALVARPAWRERYGAAWGALGVIALAGTVLTAGAGEKLFDREASRGVSSVLHDHKEAADTLKVLMFVFVAIILLMLVRDWRARMGSPIGGPAVVAALAVVTLLFAGATGFFVVRTGHLGSKATWGEKGGDQARDGSGEGGP
jgi:uncharacterized membrane protein